MQNNPYVGPRSFQAGETLYGRDRETRELRALLVAERIVLLYSPSGAGKSSLVQAALIPMLLRRRFFVRPIVRVNIDPGSGGNRYVRSTLLSLEEGTPEPEQLPEAELASLALDAYLIRRPPPADTAGEVLIFDQFEEVLTADPTDVAAKRAFFEQLGEALSDRDRWALFAMREDYVAGLDPYIEAIPTRLHNTFRLDLLGLEAAREVIRRPALAAGIAFAEEAADRLAADLSRVLVQRADGALEEHTGPTVEPVQLQVVCYRLWDGLPEDAAGIGAAEVAALGDVNRALADYYAAGVARAAAVNGVRERAVRAWFDRQLITPQGVRGTVLQGPAESQGLPNIVVRPLVDAYLVRGEKRRGATWLELAHDRLIEPVRTDNAAWFAANLSALQRHADVWARQGRPGTLLLRDEALAEAERWAAANPDDLNEAERELLRLSQEARAVRQRELRQARRIRALLVGAAALVLALAVAGGIAYWNDLRARAEARLADSRELAAAAVDSLGADPGRSLLLARAAAAVSLDAGENPTSEAREALHQATQAARARRIIVANPPEANPRGLQAVAYSPDGTLLAATSNDGSLRIWEASTGAERLRIAADPRGLNGLAFSPDGARVAAAAFDSTVIWDVATGAELVRLARHEDEVLNLAYSPDGLRIATAGRDGTVRLWDAVTGAEQLRLKIADAEMAAVAFSPDGARVVTAGGDGFARLWDAATGDELLAFEADSNPLTFVSFSPRGDLLATSSGGTLIKLWAAESGQLHDVLRGHDSLVQSLGFSHDGATLASAGADGTARLWDIADGRAILTLAGHFDDVSAVAFSPDGDSLATSSQDGTVRVWSLSLAPPGGAYYVAYSPDGTLLATAGGAGAIVWDAATGASLYALATEAVAGSVAFGAGGLLAVGDYGGQIQVVDAATGEPITTLVDTPDGVNKILFSPGGELATAGGDGVVRVWDVAAGTARLELLARPEAEQIVPPFSLAFSPDGALLASGDEKGLAVIWDTATGAARVQLTATPEQPLNGLAFSPDGRLLAGADAEGQTWVWDVATGAELRRLAARAPVLNVAFSPDGGALVTAGRDRRVTLWDTRGWEALERIPHPADVNDLSYSRDGTRLATTANDGIARVLPLDLDSLLRLAEQRTLRQPTTAECAAYPQLQDGCGR